MWTERLYLVREIFFSLIQTLNGYCNLISLKANSDGLAGLETSEPGWDSGGLVVDHNCATGENEAKQKQGAIYDFHVFTDALERFNASRFTFTIQK
jgi:hypothetical protein